MFKIQKTFKPSRAKKPIQSNIATEIVPKLSFTLKQQTLLHYNVEDLIAIIDAFFEQEISESNISLTVKAMTVISCSLKDSKIVKRVNQIFSRFLESSNSISKTESVFIFFACCFQRNIQIDRIIDTLQKKLKISVVSFLFSQYLFGSRTQDFPGFEKSLEQLFSIGQTQQIIDEIASQCLNSFMQSSTPLKKVLKRVCKISSKNSLLLEFLRKTLQFMISKRQKEVTEILQLYIEQDTVKAQIVQLIDQIISKYQALSTPVEQSLKKSITYLNLLRFNQKVRGKQLQSLFRGARRQWINDPNNWWDFINRNYTQANFQKRNQIVSLGLKQIDNQQHFNEIITVKYLYDFFNNRSQQKIQQVEGQAAFLSKLTVKNQCLTDISKALLNCYTQKVTKTSSYKIMQINTIYYPKNWKVLSLEYLESIKASAGVKQQLQGLMKAFKNASESALSNGKKLDLAALVISFSLINQRQKTICLTINQFIKFLVQNRPESCNESFQTQLPLSFKSYQQKKQNSKAVLKKDQIVIEALIVKYMKKNHQESFSVQKISQKVQIEVQICAKAMISLTRKGLVDKSQQAGKQQQFIYMA